MTEHFEAQHIVCQTNGKETLGSAKSCVDLEVAPGVEFESEGFNLTVTLYRPDDVSTRLNSGTTQS